MRYRNEIDGLRAVAVLGVFFFHLNWPMFKGGWLGVDVFFVISGFLISSLLLKEMESTGSVSLSDFYLRRVRRIMPALLVCLLFAFGVGLLFSGTHYFTEFVQSVFAALLSVSNFFFWQHAGYFAVDSHFVPLLHTWTLGVEEQFYLIIPAAFFFIAGLGARGRKSAWGAIGLVIGASFLLCRYGQGFLGEDFRFYMLPTRFWELGIGVLVALLLHYKGEISRRTWGHELCAVGSICWLAFAFTQYEGNSYFAEKSLFVCLATALFLITATSSTLVGRVFSTRPMRFIGKISYSLYLFHWPFIVLLSILAFKYDFTVTNSARFGVVAATVVLATLSWKFVEKPFRKKSTWGGCLKALTPMVTLVAVAVLGGVVFLGSDSSKIRPKDDSKYADATFEEVLKREFPLFGPKGKPRFMVIGDSHARASAYAFEALAQEYDISGRLGTASSTSPLNNVRPLDKIDQPPFAQEWLRFIEEKKIKHVFLVAKWDSFLEAPERFKSLDGENFESPAPIAKEFQHLVQSLVSSGHTVWILRQVPRFEKDPVLAVRLISDTYSEKKGLNELDFVEYALEGISSPQLHILDASPQLVENNTLAATKSGNLLYYDSHHLSRAGALLLKDVFRPAFRIIKYENN